MRQVHHQLETFRDLVRAQGTRSADFLLSESHAGRRKPAQDPKCHIPHPCWAGERGSVTSPHFSAGKVPLAPLHGPSAAQAGAGQGFAGEPILGRHSSLPAHPAYPQLWPHASLSPDILSLAAISPSRLCWEISSSCFASLSAVNSGFLTGPDFSPCALLSACSTYQGLVCHQPEAWS